MKALGDVRAALEDWLRGLDINVPPDVVAVSGAVGTFRVNNQPDGGVCDAVAAFDVKLYVSRAEEGSALDQVDRLQTEIPDLMEGQRGGPWLTLRCLSSSITEEPLGDARYVVAVFACEVWV